MTTQADPGQLSLSENERAPALPSRDATSSIQETELDDGGLLLHRCGRAPRGAERLESSRIITMVWGDRYVDDLLNLTMPALLAPNNLPAFSTQFQTELVVVTETRLFERFRRAPVFAKVLEYCDVRLLPIDDLLSPWYGITLTYALVRGFADLGPAMVDTHLVFINADFILANGSYRKLAEVIKRGERLVVSPSYCMNLESTLPRLRAARDKQSLAISMAPRDMAALLIENRHNTIRAKTANQQLFRIHRYDQFYWYVDDHTLLARQLPIAVVYMRPERVLTVMPTFWDYGVISEFCPNIKPCILGDSDDFLMAELRASNAFSELFHLGWPPVKEIAADLSSFTTQDHRDYGRHSLVLHSRDIPPGIEKNKAEFDQFVDAVYQLLSPPISYRNHKFWAAAYPQFAARQAVLAQERKQKATLRSKRRTRADYPIGQRRIEELRVQADALEAERRKLDDEASEDAAKAVRLETDIGRSRKSLSETELHRDKHRQTLQSQIEEIYRQLEAAIAESAEGYQSPSASQGTGRTLPAFSRVLQWFNQLYDQVFGRMPYVGKLHPLHAVLRQILPVLARANQQGSNYLFVSSGGVIGSGLKQALIGKGLTITPEMARSDLYEGIQHQKIGMCLCDLSFEELFLFRETFDKIRPYMGEGGKFICFFYNGANIDLDAWTNRLTHLLFPTAGRSRVSFTGSRVAALNMSLYTWMYRNMNYGVFGLVRTALLLGFCAALAQISALVERRRNPQVLPSRCTSMTIEIDL